MSSAWVAEMQLEVLVGMSERVMCDQRGDVREFGRFGLEEFAARGRVEEEIADGDGGAAGQAGVFHAMDFSAGDLEQRAGGSLRRCGFRA